MSSLEYRPEIDGLRTFAILPVIAFHLGAPWLPGGYLGVDVFFVISGYLIGSILFREIDSGQFRFRDFWMRRLRRIGPALFVMMLVVVIAGGFWMFRPTLAVLGADTLASTFSLANFAMLAKSGDYWGAEAESSPLLHTWSLSVEEQFYLVFPVLLFALKKWKWNRTAVLAGLVTLSLGLSLAWAEHHQKVAFYTLPTRAWELAVGALLAALPVRKSWPVLVRSGLAALGWVLMTASYFASSNEDLRNLAWLSVLGAALVIRYARASGPEGVLLTNPATVFVGKISYSLYLWHWPVIVFAALWEVQAQTKSSLVLLLAIITVLALTSYFLVEVPLRRARRFFPVFLPLLAAVVVIAAGLWGIRPPAYPDRGYVFSFSRDQYDLSPLKPLNKDAYLREGVRGGDSSQASPQVVVVGDSHGAAWGPTIDAVCSRLGVGARFFTLVGNRPFFPIPLIPTQESGKYWTPAEKDAYASNLLAKLDEWRPRVVVLVCKWQNYPASEIKYMREFMSYVAARGASVLVFEQGPVFSFGNFDAAEYLSYLGVVPREGSRLYLNLADDAALRANSSVAASIALEPSARLFRFRDQLVRDGKGLILDGKNLLFRDEDHPTRNATDRAAPALEVALGNLLAAR